MSRAGVIALFLCLLAVMASALIAEHIYERMPHLEDEIAYAWQAKVIASGHLTVPSPPWPKSFLVPFVVDYGGRRFAKYPLGWPTLLGMGVRLGLRDWVNPLLAGLAIWLTYCLGRKVMGEFSGLLAAALTLLSPFFLLNTASLLSHPLGLVLSAAFALAWLDAFWKVDSVKVSSWLSTVTAALCLGVLILSRPFTALGVVLPFVIHGAYLWLGGDWCVRRRLLAFSMIVLTLGCLYFVWQYAVSGDPWLNPYTLWWEYDRVGFGPGHGVVEPYGHTLHQAWFDTRQSLIVGSSDLFGWPYLSWIFLPAGIWAVRGERRAWLLAAVFPSLVVTHLAYWVNARLYGPRYYFEGLYSLTLLSAAGITWLADLRCSKWLTVCWRRFFRLVLTAVLASLIAVNLAFYLPVRLNAMHNLYGINRARLAPFQSASAQALTPALILVDTPKWMPYGALLELQDPWLTTPFIFAMAVGPKTDAAVIASFPERAAYYYRPEEPYTFFIWNGTDNPNPQ